MKWGFTLRGVVRLTWDWRGARVYDDAGSCVDEVVWSAHRSAGAVADRLARIGAGRMTAEARTLAERFPEAVHVDVAALADTGVTWPAMDADEVALMQEATLRLASRGVAAMASDPDRRLEHLVRATEELRAAHNTLEGRIVEWAGLFLPGLDLDGRRGEIAPATAAADGIDSLASALGVTPAEADVGAAEWDAIRGWAAQTVVMGARLEGLESAVRELANQHLPSLSALLGPLLAARICVTAHGRARLARLPSGTIQILGAEKAFFMHLKQGIDPPKHGHIFQHPWINRSPRWVRGKIARLIAGKAAIAARVDHFGGEPWGSSEVAEVEAAVGAIRDRFPKPRGRN